MPRNKFIRDYISGKQLSDDLSQMIKSELIQNYSGNTTTSEVSRGAFSAVAKKYKVSVSTVTHHWKTYCSGARFTKLFMTELIHKT